MAIYNDSGELNLFGFTITKKDKKDSEAKSFVPQQDLNGGTEVVTNSGAAFNSYSIDLDPSAIKQEADLIAKYREISLIADVDLAISEINDEFLVVNETEPLIQLDFIEEFAEKYSDKTKKLITDEFDNVLKLLKFKQVGPDIARNWYIDGRCAFHKVVDLKSPKDGIKELRPIDVARLKRIVEIVKEKDPVTNATVIKGQNDYYVYAELQGQHDQKTGLKIAPESIAYVTSGLVDRNTGTTISYLHKAIRPMNQLRMMEDSDVIYRLTRAPERRVFYIDTQGMARTKAEQYIKDVMARYKNKQVYNAQTGTVMDSTKHMSILEDFFLPRNSAGKGTEITNLPGGGTLGSIENTTYFQQKLWASLNLPLSRMQPGQGTFNIGRSNEITRDEIKFAKFISKLRMRFNLLFIDILKTQLLLKGITTLEDWEILKESFVFVYSKDNFFAELKESDILRERLTNVQQADAYIGKYFSRRHIMREILKFTDEECDQMEEQISKEAPTEVSDAAAAEANNLQQQ
jgi:hypothetical protein